ncbi:MAG: glycosyltransferase family 4 protein [Thermoproteota archaeon]|jgi:glycosyltransferase involved in cell wall biosynthesis|nr:glycosyltransferase family 4 protein [Thermoproteota archaeon]
MSRILFISYVANQHSGVGNRVYYLSRELAKRGHEVHVITKEGEYVSDQVNAYHVQIPKHIFKIPPVPLPQVSIFNLLAYKKFEEIKYKINPDLIDVQHVHISPIVHMIKEKDKLAITCQGTEIGLFNLSRNYLSLINLVNSRFEKDTFEKSKIIITASEFLKKELICYYNLPSHKIVTIHNGIDIKEYEFSNIIKIGLKDKLGVSNIILFVGGFSRRKGIHILLKALSEIKEKDWILIIVGGGDLKSREEFINLSKSLNIENKIVNLPFISSRERELLKSILFEADIFVHPSLYEGFSLAILEAMAAGKAIIATRRGGTPEALNNAGILIRASSEELKNALELLISDIELRKKYSKLAKERAKIFDWTQIAEKYNSYLL